MNTKSPVNVLFRGTEYLGEYLDGRMLHVFFDGKSKTGHIRGSDPQLLARLLFIELLSGF
jgi:hypothetical protein